MFGVAPLSVLVALVRRLGGFRTRTLSAAVLRTLEGGSGGKIALPLRVMIPSAAVSCEGRECVMVFSNSCGDRCQPCAISLNASSWAHRSIYNNRAIEMTLRRVIPRRRPQIALVSLVLSVLMRDTEPDNSPTAFRCSCDGHSCQFEELYWLGRHGRDSSGQWLETLRDVQNQSRHPSIEEGSEEVR
jgi:hypothetical protein